MTLLLCDINNISFYFIRPFGILLLKGININCDTIKLIFLETSNKKIKKENVKHLFEQHTSDYCNIQEQMLKLKQEKLAIGKEVLEFKKKLTKNIPNFCCHWLRR